MGSRRMQRGASTTGWGVAAMLLLAGCAGEVDAGSSVEIQPTQAIATDIASELLEPLEGLGPCGDPPDAIALASSIPGLHLPEGARVTAVTEDGPLTQVEGWVELTPIGVRADYVTRQDIEVLSVEDEVWESETLVTDGQHRLFVKAQGICRTQSIFVGVVTPDGEQ